MGSEIATKADSVSMHVGYQDSNDEDKTAKLKIYYYQSNEKLNWTYPPKLNEVVKTLAETYTIQSGEVKEINIPLKNGEQYFFAEITQENDFDKILLAPFWVTKE